MKESVKKRLKKNAPQVFEDKLWKKETINEIEEEDINDFQEEGFSECSSAENDK